VRLLQANTAFAYRSEKKLTVHDGKTAVLIGTGRSGLTQNPDGSIDIFIQKAAPVGHESNWLPAPSGNFILWLRAYMPGEAILDGKYTVPAVVEVK
jgi:hypothetical protein